MIPFLWLNPGLTLLAISTFIIQKAVKERNKYVSLQALPGPPPSSLLFGNLDKFFDAKESVGWHQHLTEKYGSAVRLTGPFGSKFLLVLCDTVFGFLMFDQEPQVFLSDPKGLETVLIKEGDVFEKPE